MAGRQLRSLFTALAAIGLTVALVLGQATGTTVHSLVTLVNTVIGIGGGKDSLSERIPNKLNKTVVPPGYVYIGVEYPATLDMTDSVRVGMPVLREHFDNTSGKIIVAGYSEGALLVEQLKRDVAASTNSGPPPDVSFLQIATPFIPNGGIYARFPGLSVPGIFPGLAIPGMGPAQPTQFDTTYIVNEYDTYGDFPAYFNPVALLNSLLAHNYAHVDSSYDPMDPTAAANHVKKVSNGAGGIDTYILVPNPRLPLLGPLRDIAYHLGVSAPAERLLGLIEPLLRIVVDMAYTDRENLNPEVRKPFSVFTPPHKVIEALTAVPGALREGVDNLLGVKRPPAVVTPTAVPPLAAASAQAEVQPEGGLDAEDAPGTDRARKPEIAARTEPAVAPDARPEPVAVDDPRTAIDEQPVTEPEDGTEHAAGAPPTVKKAPRVTLRESPRRTFGGAGTAADTTESPARPTESDQDSRDGGAEAA